MIHEVSFHSHPLFSFGDRFTLQMLLNKYILGEPVPLGAGAESGWGRAKKVMLSADTLLIDVAV